MFYDGILGVIYFIEGGDPTYNSIIMVSYVDHLMKKLGIECIPDVEVNINITNEALDSTTDMGHTWGDSDEMNITITTKNCSIVDRMLTLAHEMVHVKQYLLGELSTDNGYLEWHGEPAKKYKKESRPPWEVEAYALESELLKTWQ